ncbi:MAG: DUF4390 domain-containing protein [Gammaproteobacteria bacterium]
MRGFANVKTFRLFILVFCLRPLPTSAGEFGISIDAAQLHLKDQAYVLDTDIAYRLTPKVLKTVQNGIPLMWLLRVQVYRERHYLWDERLVDVQQRYRIRYHALMNIYHVLDENRGEASYFSTLTAALEAIGTIRAMPVPGLSLLSDDGIYFARIKMQLDREALPLPLRPLSYINSDWYLSSDWYTWPLQK